MEKIVNVRATAEIFSKSNPVLKSAEVGLEIDTGKFKVGDGVKCWNDLGYNPALAVVPVGYGVPIPLQGVPDGGKKGQILVKLSDDDFDIGWADLVGQVVGPAGPVGPEGPWLAPGGGEENQVLAKNSNKNYDFKWRTIHGGGPGG